MSVASPNISKKSKTATNEKNDEIEKKESRNEKKEHLPAMKSYAQSPEKSQSNEEWLSEKLSFIASEQAYDDAASESVAASFNDTTTPTTLTATTTTTTSSSTNTTTTTTTTTTSTTPQKSLTVLQSLPKESLIGDKSGAESRIDFSLFDSKEGWTQLQDFLNDAERHKLTISYQTKEGMRNLQQCLLACTTQQMTAAPNKEIVIEMGLRLDYETLNLLGGLSSSIERSGLVTAISLKGDDVLQTHPRIRHLLDRTPGIHTLQISEVKSDTVCQTFKIWSEYQYVPSTKTTAGLKIRRLCFSGLKISDAAVFGSALRDMLAKMPNIKTVDFSQTALSAEQKDILRFQLAPLGRQDLLEF